MQSKTAKAFNLKQRQTYPTQFSVTYFNETVNFYLLPEIHISCETHNFTTFIWQFTILVHLPNNYLSIPTNCNILLGLSLLLTILLNSWSKHLTLFTYLTPITLQSSKWSYIFINRWRGFLNSVSHPPPPHTHTQKTQTTTIKQQTWFVALADFYGVTMLNMVDFKQLPHEIIEYLSITAVTATCIINISYMLACKTNLN